MRKLRSVIVGLSFSIFVLSALLLAIGEDATASGIGTTEAESRDKVSWSAQPMSSSEVMATSETRVSTGVQVTLSAAHWTTSWDERDPERSKFGLPLLYLHRQREGTDKADRTLDIHIAGLAGGTEIEVEVISHHENAYTAERHTQRERFVLPDHPCAVDDPCTLQWTFDPATTPSDLYHLLAKDTSGKALWSSPYADRPDLVMLDTWDVPLGAYAVRVYYAALFPFARDPDRIDYRLPPEAVPGYIEHQFVPMINDTWQTQFETWGFGAPIHPDWDSDKIVEVIITYPPFALFDGTGTYTIFVDPEQRPYPERRIWWLSTHAAFQRYDSWENAHRAIFAHEFFHLAQWNALLHTGRPTSYWLNGFIEAQADFAIGAQYPELEIGAGHAIAGFSVYGRSANRFLAYRLNTSYQELEADPTSKYDLALYWRFLFEQYHHMEIIRAALEEMAHHHQSNVVSAMSGVMNAAFARFDGPFHSFEESLIAFARAIYALRLDGGRCTEPGISAGCGFYDPDNLYYDPPLSTITYTGADQRDPGEIRSSFGIDFADVVFDPAADGQPLTLEFHSAPGADAVFNVQLWKLMDPGEDARPQRVPSQTTAPEVLTKTNADGHLFYVIPAIDTNAYNRLGLIITRVDANESTDPIGAYTIVLHPDAEQ